MSKQNTPDVSTPCQAYLDMREASKLPITLRGGTAAMRTAKEAYLPKEEAETDTAYANRVKRTFLFNKYLKTSNDLGGRLFKNGVTLDKVPAELEPMLEDVDLTGRDLGRFSRDVFDDAVDCGVTYLLVEYPSVPTEEGVDGKPKLRSVADEKALGLRPYLVHIKQANLFNWRSETVQGKERLTRVQIMESVEEEAGEWGSETIEQIRVLEPGLWTTYRQDPATKEWKPYEQGFNTLDFIPLIAVYTNRVAFMVGRPLLENLAELNLAHWQSSSDQRNILHVARVPILFGAGFADGTTLVAGANSFITASSPQASLQYVEHTGKAIEAGANDLRELENQMKVCAMEPLVPKTGTQTATAKAIDTAEAACTLQTIGEDLGDVLEEAMIFMMIYMGKQTDNAGTVKFDCDYSATLGQQADLDALSKARAGRDISRQTYQKELKRRDVLSEDFDPIAEQTLLDAEGPDLGTLTAGMGELPKGKN